MQEFGNRFVCRYHKLFDYSLRNGALGFGYYYFAAVVYEDMRFLYVQRDRAAGFAPFLERKA